MNQRRNSLIKLKLADVEQDIILLHNFRWLICLTAMLVLDYHGKSLVALQVGPVMRGTALRDAVGFIQFDQFANQLQFADVANQLNERALAAATKDFDLAQAVGKGRNAEAALAYGRATDTLSKNIL
jgi:predicted lipoprotein